MPQALQYTNLMYKSPELSGTLTIHKLNCHWSRACHLCPEHLNDGTRLKLAISATHELSYRDCYLICLDGSWDGIHIALE